MHKNVRFAFAAAIAVVLAGGVSYLSWSSAPSRIDALAIMTATKNLPNEHFEAF